MRNLRVMPFVSLLLLSLLVQSTRAKPGPIGPMDEQPTKGRGPTLGVTSSLTGAAMLQGLVAYYPFNGNASDASGNQHTGIVHGAVLSTDRFSIPNSAYSFNGVNAYIEVAHDASLNPQNAITYTGWFQANSLSQVGNILSKGIDFSSGLYVARLHPPPINLGLGIMFTQDQPSVGPTSVNPSNIAISVGQWYFFALTYDGQTLCSYMDGVLIKSLQVSKTLGSNQEPLAIGKNPQPGYEYWFNGKIDDICLYNRALNPTEISALYNAPPPNPDLTNGLVAYYPFNGNANDASGNGNNGTVHGASPVSSRFGVLDHAYHFNGSGNYIEIPNSASLQLVDAITVSAWIRLDPNVAQVSKVIITKGVDDQQVIPGDWTLSIDNSAGIGMRNRPHLWMSNNLRYFTGTSILQPNEWHHVVMTYDGSKLASYVNGVNEGSEAMAGTMRVTNSTLRIGVYIVNGAPGWFPGAIDDIRVYNRALSAIEINDLYREGGFSPDSLPPWRVTNTGISHTIIIPKSANPNINDIALTAGDYVGVFYDSSGTLACAGYEKWTGSGSIAVSAFGDDPTSTVKDGFAAGEEFRWRIYRASDARMFDAEALYTPVGGVVTSTNTYATNGISQLVALAGVFTTHCVDIRSGWSLFSSYVSPQKPSLDSIFKPVLSDVIIVKNGAQKTFIPSVQVNSIGSWVNAEGYQVKMSNLRSLCITGQKIVPQALTIGLPRGWSIMPYVRDTDMPIESALSGVVGDVVIVKDQDGKTYIPSVGVNGIGALNAGQAYQIKMAKAHTIEYPSMETSTKSLEYGSSTNGVNATTSAPPWFYTNTGVNQSIIIPAGVNPGIDGIPIVVGDCVGVFYDSSGTLACAGYVMWSGTSPFAVSAFGDDPTTTVKDGLASGETLRWKIWRRFDNREIKANPSYIAPGELGGMVTDTGTYNTNGISAISALKGSITSVTSRDIPTEYTLMQNYPNPFNLSTRIGYALPRNSHVSLTVLNTVGQIVAILVNGLQEAGYHEIQFDASRLSSGLYLYRIRVRPLDFPLSGISRSQDSAQGGIQGAESFTAGFGKSGTAVGRDSKSGAGDFVQTRKLLLLR